MAWKFLLISVLCVRRYWLQLSCLPGQLVSIASNPLHIKCRNHRAGVQLPYNVGVLRGKHRPRTIIHLGLFVVSGFLESFTGNIRNIARGGGRFRLLVIKSTVGVFKPSHNQCTSQKNSFGLLLEWKFLKTQCTLGTPVNSYNLHATGRLLGWSWIWEKERWLGWGYMSLVCNSALDWRM